MKKKTFLILILVLLLFSLFIFSCGDDDDDDDDDDSGVDDDSGDDDDDGGGDDDDDDSGTSNWTIETIISGTDDMYGKDYYFAIHEDIPMVVLNRDPNNKSSQPIEWWKKQSGSWTHEVIENAAGDSDIYFCIKGIFDSHGFPAYFWEDDTGNSGYQFWNGSLWDYHDLPGLVAARDIEGMALNGENRPSFVGSFINSYTVWDGSDWVDEDYTDNIDVSPFGLALSSDNTPHVIFGDYTIDMRYTVKNDGIWTTEIVLNEDRGPADDGSITVDNGGNPHICFTTAPYTEVTRKILYSSNAGTSWQTETVYESDDNYISVGYNDQSIRVDSAGQIYLGFIELATEGNSFTIYLAVKSNGSWSNEIVLKGSSEFNVPFYLDLDSAGKPHMVIAYNDELLFATRP